MKIEIWLPASAAAGSVSQPLEPGAGVFDEFRGARVVCIEVDDSRVDGAGGFSCLAVAAGPRLGPLEGPFQHPVAIAGHRELPLDLAQELARHLIELFLLRIIRKQRAERYQRPLGPPQIADLPVAERQLKQSLAFRSGVGRLTSPGA